MMMMMMMMASNGIVTSYQLPPSKCS